MVKWSSPPLGWIKCNVDALVRDKQVAEGIVCRDDMGSAVNVWDIFIFPIVEEASSIVKGREDWSFSFVYRCCNEPAH